MKHKKSRNTLRKYFDPHSPVTGELIPCNRPINLVMDATFFSRSDGVLVCRANQKNVYWKEIDGEKIRYYREMLHDLMAVGFQFSSFVIDGRRGVKELLLQMFPTTPLQLCQFHQIKVVIRYLSQKPKLEAGKELRAITLTLTRTTEDSFVRRLRVWYGTWCGFLRERTVDAATGRWRYTHDRVRSSYFSA